ncbi:MAG: DUF5615 family PIN-like protein [Anaerolineae bacterium]
MGLRLFADHCVSTAIVQALQQAGHEVILLRRLLPADAPDTQVISRAQELEAILVSLNCDFADIVAYPPHGIGVLWRSSYTITRNSLLVSWRTS